MNWFQQNRFLGIFLAALVFATLLSVYFLLHEKSAADREEARLETTINELTRLRRSSAVPERRKSPQDKGADRELPRFAAGAEERVEAADVSEAASPA